ncbi:MAG: methyltransferase, partial [Chitinophagaceae bacterium]
SKKAGLTHDEILAKVEVPDYGLRVLLEAGLGIGLVTIDEGKYRITKTGHFILNDQLTRINMDFVHDVNYKGMFHLDEAIATGKPAGLKELGNWPTIYEGLSQLPQHIQKSWFAFDHYFSDSSFPLVLPMVYSDPNIRKLMDIGGNTGKWATASTMYNPDVHVTIVDLPGQVGMAQEKIAQLGLSQRVSFYPVNLLDSSQALPKGYDAIWMSQFLDCFSEAEITSIVQRCYDALEPGGTMFILEAFWDRQRFETAAFCLQQTSIYFTALANGNSQMYDSRIFNEAVKSGGFEIYEEIDGIGLSHTLLKCRKK